MILTFYNLVYYVISYVIEYITPHITKATRFCPRRFSLFCIFTFIFFHELHFSSALSAPAAAAGQISILLLRLRAAIVLMTITHMFRAMIPRNHPASTSVG